MTLSQENFYVISRQSLRRQKYSQEKKHVFTTVCSAVVLSSSFGSSFLIHHFAFLADSDTTHLLLGFYRKHREMRTAFVMYMKGFRER